MSNYKIIQMIPAPADMFAVFEEEDGKLYKGPLACLALIEHQDDDENEGLINYREIMGFYATNEEIDSVENFENFKGYYRDKDWIEIKKPGKLGVDI